jgi:hypothetical protein
VLELITSAASDPTARLPPELTLWLCSEATCGTEGGVEVGITSAGGEHLIDAIHGRDHIGEGGSGSGNSPVVDVAPQPPAPANTLHNTVELCQK